MKVLVTGGRDYDDVEHVFATLDAVHAKTPITLLICGACAYGGADRIAVQWAVDREVDFRGYPAKFKTGPGGKAEGPKRNLRMQLTEEPELVVAFPGGKGTEGMCYIAQTHGTPVQRAGYRSDRKACPICNATQFPCPSGMVCENGHGF